MKENQISINLYTQKGHDHYLQDFPNEKWFLHLTKDTLSDGMEDTEEALNNDCYYLSNYIKNTPTIYPWNFYHKKSNQFALYIFPEKELQNSFDIQNISDELVQLARQHSAIHGLTIKSVNVDPTENLYLKILIQARI